MEKRARVAVAAPGLPVKANFARPIRLPGCRSQSLVNPFAAVAALICLDIHCNLLQNPIPQAKFLSLPRLGLVDNLDFIRSESKHLIMKQNVDWKAGRGLRRIFQWCTVTIVGVVAAAISGDATQRWLINQ